MIKQAQQQINKINYEEEETVEDDDDDDERTTVVNKITTQQQERITKSTKTVVTYKEKITYLVKQISVTTTKVVTLRKTVSELKTTIDTHTQKILELTKTLREKQDYFEKNPTSTTIVTEIETIKTTIIKTEKIIKTTRKEYVGVYAESTSLQKLIDFYTSTKKEYDDNISDEEEE